MVIGYGIKIIARLSDSDVALQDDGWLAKIMIWSWLIRIVARIVKEVTGRVDVMASRSNRSSILSGSPSM